MSHEDDLFDEDSVLGLVGTNEQELRKLMGNENFEEHMEWVRTNKMNSVAMDLANVRRMGNIANCWYALAVLIPWAFLLVTAASIFAMVMWALH